MGAIDRALDLDKPAETTAAGDGRRSARAGIPVETRSQGGCYADLRQQADGGWDRSRKFDAPREELARFSPEDAGLPEVSIEEAGHYIERHRNDRPWLQAVERASPEARRIIVANDLVAAVHGHIRHEGRVSEEASMRRAAFLEDPPSSTLASGRAAPTVCCPAMNCTSAVSTPPASPTRTRTRRWSSAAASTPTSAAS